MRQGHVLVLLLLTPRAAATLVGTKTVASAGSRRSSLREPSASSICNIVDVLGEVMASFEEWQRNDTGTFKEVGEMFHNEFLVKEKAVKEAEDSIDEASADLDSAKTEGEDLKVQLEATKRSMLAIQAEVTDLRDRLKTRRAEYKDKQASASASANAASAALNERASIVRRQTIGLTRLQALARLQSLRRGLTYGNEFLQKPKFQQQYATALKQSGVTVSALQRVPEDIRDQKEALEKDMRNEEVEIGKLVAQKEKDSADIQQELERLQATYAGKLEQIAATQRDLANNQRMHDRDHAVAVTIGMEVNTRAYNLKMYMEDRRTIITSLGTAVGELKGNGCAAASSLAQVATARGFHHRRSRQHRVWSWASRPSLGFLQMSTKVRGGEALMLINGAAGTQDQQMADLSSLAEDPFADVKERIQQLIAAAQKAINEGMEHADWCADEKSTNEQASVTKKEDLDVKLAVIREQKAELARIADQTSFTNSEIGRLDQVIAEIQIKQRLDKSKVSTIVQDHNLALECLDQAINVLRKFYGLAGTAEHAGENSGGKIVNQLLEIKKLIQGLTAKIQRGVEEEEFLSTDLLAESKLAKEARVKERDDLVASDSNTADLLSQAQGDAKLVQTELKRLEQYTEELQGECGPQSVDYDARKKRRAEEIEALKDALKVLSGEAIPAGSASAAASLLQSGAGIDDLQTLIQETTATQAS